METKIVEKEINLVGKKNKIVENKILLVEIRDRFSDFGVFLVHLTAIKNYWRQSPPRHKRV